MEATSGKPAAGPFSRTYSCRAETVQLCRSTPAAFGPKSMTLAIQPRASSVMERGAPVRLPHTGTHPAVLKDMVCSPAGTTIEAVAELERGGLRATVIDAMLSCAERNRQMA